MTCSASSSQGNWMVLGGSDGWGLRPSAISTRFGSRSGLVHTSVMAGGEGRSYSLTKVGVGDTGGEGSGLAGWLVAGVSVLEGTGVSSTSGMGKETKSRSAAL